MPPAQWVNATGKFAVRDLDGSKVLVKLAENPFAFAKRCRPFFSGTEYSDYTIQADVRAMERRRQMGDIGIVAQRYELVLFGTTSVSICSRGNRKSSAPSTCRSSGTRTRGTR